MSEDETHERLADKHELGEEGPPGQAWDDEKPWPEPQPDPEREPSHPWARIGIDEK